MRTKENSVRLSASFPEVSYDRLLEIAEQKKVSLAWVVREAVEEYVARSLFPEPVSPPAPALSVVNIATVKHLSPFRYPGGKTWLVPFIRQWLSRPQRNVTRLLEPFAGGASVGLMAVSERLVDELYLVEKDDDVAAVWKTILWGDGEKLIKRILDFEMNEANVRKALERTARDTTQHAFQTLLKNRVQRGGILAAGASFMRKGENGRGIASRWYPETLANRIRQIADLRTRITFYHGDAFDVFPDQRPTTAIFVDPPYTKAGRRLYTHSEIDHPMLFKTLSESNADVLMTYDKCEDVLHMASGNGFHCASIPMKSTHHTIKEELVISKDLTWLSQSATIVS